jgi:hypothetical protein
MKYLLISMLILLASCAEFPIDVQQKLNCEPAKSNGCAGWLPPKED